MEDGLGGSRKDWKQKEQQCDSSNRLGKIIMIIIIIRRSIMKKNQ